MIGGSGFRDAQATLSFMLLVSGIIIEIAIAGSFVTYFLSSAGLGERLTTRAFAAAEAGVRDAEIKIARDKEFAEAGAVAYTLAVGSDETAVEVSRSTANPAGYVFTATSTGTAVNRSRRLVVVLTVERMTGLLQVRSLAEAAF